jgi:hypothetical protein
MLSLQTSERCDSGFFRHQQMLADGLSHYCRVCKRQHMRDIRKHKAKFKKSPLVLVPVPVPVSALPMAAPMIGKVSRKETERHVAALLGDLFDRSYYRELNLWSRPMEVEI